MYCLSAKPILQKFHLPKQNWADGGMPKIKVNPTHVSDQMGHRVHTQRPYHGLVEHQGELDELGDGADVALLPHLGVLEHADDVPQEIGRVGRGVALFPLPRPATGTGVRRDGAPL